MLTHAIGCLGAALSMSLSWPQVYKSCVQRRTGGLSSTASALGVALPLGWITYGLLSGEHIQIVTNVVTGAAGLAILVALLVTQPALRSGRALRMSAGAFAGVLTMALLSGLAAVLPGVRGHQVAPVLGLALAAFSILSAIPQPLSLLRDRHQDLSGLSPLRWRMGAGAGASWFAYGLGTAQPAVWASAVVGLISALTVCTIIHLRSDHAAAVIDHDAARWRNSITTRNLAMAGI
ncbi:SemiSWEET transporter [Paractinoplanes rhizophilus]|jgi:hypothetical protein|uniref:SemiSWEET transporter n=1 Tax=Paractinoplanes rhizophilus TaxID=1416877 RepID=A0ABW2I1K9_9ACTN|nr:SemiSWEET transporter [Actinoplanes sp.]